MKQNLFLALFVFFSINSFSQISKFSLEASYPIPTGDNFIGKSYKGIIDLGAKYRFAETANFNFGASMNGGILKNNTNKNQFNRDFTITAYTIQPRVFTEINIKSISKLHPFAGLGYTFMLFKGNGTNNEIDLSEEKSIKENGINANLGLAYDITNKVFLHLQYDYVKLNPKNDIPNTSFNTNVSLAKIGIGLRL